MNSVLSIGRQTLFLAVLLCTALAVTAAAPISLEEARKDKRLGVSLSGNGRTEIVVAVQNHSSSDITLRVQAPLFVRGKNGRAMVGLRGTTITVPASGAADVALPAAPLSLANKSISESLELYSPNPQLKALIQPLVDFSSTKDDLPRSTTSMTALLLVGEVSLQKWRDHLGREPTGEDLLTIIDALALAKALAPERMQPLARDPEFRLRAIRSPITRGKAMQVLGVSAPEGVPIPDINQLLHTKPGDNCPVCKMRERAANQDNAP